MSVLEVQTAVHPSSSVVQSGAVTVPFVQHNSESPVIRLYFETN
jgi:hypothetical protein